MTCNDPTCNQDRERKMVILERNTIGKPTVWCDPCIAPLVKALNDAGFRTVASCCGHGHRPGNIVLEDGQELVIARDWDEARRIDKLFPVDINGDLTATATAGEPWTRRDLAVGLAMLDGVDIYPRQAEYADRADDLLAHLSLCASTSPAATVEEGCRECEGRGWRQYAHGNDTCHECGGAPAPNAAVDAEPGKVYVEISGLTGTGKSGVVGEIEIALKAIGLTVEHDREFQSEKNMTHADWQRDLELYKPVVILRERNFPRTALGNRS